MVSIFQNLRSGTESGIIIPSLETQSVSHRRQDSPMQAEDVVGLAEEILNESENLLLIFNTKSAVETVYETMKERFSASYQVIFLTTLFCLAHRKKAIAHLWAQLKQHEKFICVCTLRRGSISVFRRWCEIWKV